MPSTLIHGQTVIVVHRVKTGTDVRGNDVFTDENETINYCAVHAGASTETTQGTEMVASDISVMFPDGTNITAQDAFITQDGNKYEVQGSPNQFESPFTGIRSMVEVQGRLVTGASV